MYKKRLLQLADHLENGKLGHEVFDFSVYNAGRNRLSLNTCGTIGCALGECPVLWPDDWEFTGVFGRPALKGRNDPVAYESAMEWFGITYDEEDHLFTPEMQDTEEFGGEYLFGDATKEEVASNIRAFLNKDI